LYKNYNEKVFNMNSKSRDELFNLMQKLFRSHPWHGIPSGKDVPNMINVYIEIVPTDTFKYEIDKRSGMLIVDRPQQYSNVCPLMYGFIPQTYCADEVAKRCYASTGISVSGDMDPLDICVLAERPIPQGDVMVAARPIGGLRMIDKGEADDKLVAVLKGDSTYGNIKDISECPKALIERLRHYFLTYKLPPGATDNACQINEIYGFEEAREIVKASIIDYENYYPGLIEAVERYFNN
jgi:inorganic pyrophosphatase